MEHPSSKWPSSLDGGDASILSITKNKHIVATFEEHAFQLAILPEGLKHKQDPLTLPTFPIFGFHCIPNCGVYGDDYTPCLPLAIVQIPALKSALPNQVPKALYQSLFPPTNNAVEKKELESKVEKIPSTDLATTGLNQSDFVSHLDLFIIVHTHAMPSICQKFMCNNVDEVNMMYHAWLFQDLVEFSDYTTITKQVEMGLFDANGIKPVHLNLLDAGITFEMISPRTVALHGLRFSPENAMFQWDSVKIASFFSLAKTSEKSVIALHILPRDYLTENNLRTVISKASTLYDLVNAVNVVDVIASEKIKRVLIPLKIIK